MLLLVQLLCILQIDGQVNGVVDLFANADLTLAINGHKFTVNRQILAERCDFFRFGHLTSFDFIFEAKQKYN